MIGSPTFKRVIASVVSTLFDKYIDQCVNKSVNVKINFLTNFSQTESGIYFFNFTVNGNFKYFKCTDYFLQIPI